MRAKEREREKEEERKLEKERKEARDRVRERKRERARKEERKDINVLKSRKRQHQVAPNCRVMLYLTIFPVNLSKF